MNSTSFPRATRMLSQLAATLSIAISLATAVAGPHNTTTYYGEPEPLGDGLIRTFVTLDADDVPVRIGVEFDAALLENLPVEPSDGTWDVVDAGGNVVWHCCGHEVELLFHDDVAGLIPFRHFVLNWNPVGHGPPLVYTLPHFDFHFYTIDTATRTSIEAPVAEDACQVPMFSPVTCEVLDFLTLPLPADQQPPSHVNVGAVEPGMGNHLINLGSAEWHQGPFSHTWIFGTAGGELTFWEPMITVEYLNWVRDLSPSDKKSVVDPNGGEIDFKGSGASVLVPIDIPAAAPEAGLYPTQYRIQYRKPGRVFRVSLEELVLLEESGG